MNKADEIFFSVLRAGLWGKTDILPGQETDWKHIYMYAREQTVVGLVADGISVLRKTTPLTLPADVQNAFMQSVLGSEMRNRQMNATLSHISKVLAENGVNAVVLKGQGVALDYPQPMHRQPGDIDFLLDDEGYRTASELLTPKASKVEKENPEKKHLGMYFGDVEVELHGTARADFGKKVNTLMDNMQKDMFLRSDFRAWDCGGIRILLPSADFDAVFIFMHFIQHFYHGGLGLRQICDWTMHLHRFSSDIDINLLESRLTELHMKNEWRIFGWMAVNMLGLPVDEMPFYDLSCGNMAEKVWESMKISGNFGKKLNAGRDVDNEQYIYRKIKSFVGHIGWLSRHLGVSVYNTSRAFATMLSNGVSSVFKGD